MTHEVRLSVDTRQTHGGGGEESGLWVVVTGAQSSSSLVVAADDHPERVGHDLGLAGRMLAEALPKPR